MANRTRILTSWRTKPVRTAAIVKGDERSCRARIPLQDVPISTSSPRRRPPLAQLVKNVTKPRAKARGEVVEGDQGGRADPLRTKEKRRRAENRRRMAMGEDRDESDGLLNADPLKDIESFVKGDEAILPHKRFIKQARKTLQHSARIAEREVMALQAERYLETVKRNAARYGESLAASGLTGDRESVGVPSRDDEAEPEEPPKKKSKKAKKPAARKPAARKKGPRGGR